MVLKQHDTVWPFLKKLKQEVVGEVVGVRHR